MAMIREKRGRGGGEGGRGGGGGGEAGEACSLFRPRRKTNSFFSVRCEYIYDPIVNVGVFGRSFFFVPSFLMPRTYNCIYYILHNYVSKILPIKFI